MDPELPGFVLELDPVFERQGRLALRNGDGTVSRERVRVARPDASVAGLPRSDAAEEIDVPLYLVKGFRRYSRTIMRINVV